MDPRLSPVVRHRSARDDPAKEASSPADAFQRLHSPRDQSETSMRIHMREAWSDPDKSTLLHVPARIVSGVKKIMHLDEPRAAFLTNVALASRLACGVLLAGVAQTRAPNDSEKDWYLLPSYYYLGGLSWAAVMVVFAASRNVGGAIQQMWQIELGVVLALAYSIAVFALIPMHQTNIITMEAVLGGHDYVISLDDWGKILPLILAFTFVMFLAPLSDSAKKFAVSTNLYFMLTVVSPMNPVDPTTRKDQGQGRFTEENLMANLAVYSVVGFVGTLIALITMMLPYPIFATRVLQANVREAPTEIREVLNLMVDAYCFRARDIRKMDFFRLRLDRLLTAAQTRHSTMKGLLEEAWWEELVGGGTYFQFNKTSAKQFVLLYARLLKDLQAMKFSIEQEACHWTHTKLMDTMQRDIYLLQMETNDLLEAISHQVLAAVKVVSEPRFALLEEHLETLMNKYTHCYRQLLAEKGTTADDVATSLPLHLFLYSFHTLVRSMVKFERAYNAKNYSARHRIATFLKRVVRDSCDRARYPRRLLAFSLRTTLGVFIGVCFSTFVFGFSSTVPSAIAIVAQYNIGGTFSNTVNRLTGLVAGTVVPSILSAFICECSSDVSYNVLNNAALFVWSALSIYVYYSGSYIKSAGMVSAFMAATVFLDHSCRDPGQPSDDGNSTASPLTYSSLTENTLGMFTLMLTELSLKPRSARSVLRKNIQEYLAEYSTCLTRVYRHHVAMERRSYSRAVGDNTQKSPKVDNDDGVLDTAAIKQLRRAVEETFQAKLEEQAMLLEEAAYEPDLWRPVFSNDKYNKVLSECRTLLAHLRILVDLADWQQHTGSTTIVCIDPQGNTSDRGGGEYRDEPEMPASSHTGEAPVVTLETQMQWHASQDTLAASTESALDTLATLFGERFSNSNADEKAIFMQMKEAFRLADVHRRGVVDASELTVLLERLVPYSARGTLRMEQYVADFMRLVDSNGDGKISYTEFMDALNRGFRLELEIYEDMRATDEVFRQPVEQSMSQESTEPEASSSDLLLGESEESNGPHGRRRSASDGEMNAAGHPVRRSLIFDRILGAPSQLYHAATGLAGHIATTPTDSAQHASWFSRAPTTRNLHGKRGGHGRGRERAMLNVESFTINGAAAVLGRSYGAYLLEKNEAVVKAPRVDDTDLSTESKKPEVENLIQTSCLICAMREIAARLTELNTIAAS